MQYVQQRGCIMADAMVTARMTSDKKEAGNRVLEQLGTNASQAVNKLYDYVLENKELPFQEKKKNKNYTKNEIAQAIEFVDSINVLPLGNRFENMADAEIKLERLSKKLSA